MMEKVKEEGAKDKRGVLWSGARAAALYRILDEFLIHPLVMVPTV